MWPVKKRLGYITGEQLEIDGTSILPRVPVYCGDSNERSEYDIWKEAYFGYFVTNVTPRYVMICKNCGDSLELDLDEYYLIKKLIMVNRKYEKNKINGDEHSSLIEKIKNKISKR